VELVLIVVAFGLFAALAAVLGTDTRDGDDWIVHPHA
jgi:hypothetical protein